MEPREFIRKRFVQAIQKSFDPCPLIGDRWFRYHEKTTPPYFQFAGAKKLAKAIGTNPKRICAAILEHMDLRGIDGELNVTSDVKINLILKSIPKAK